MVDRPLSSGGRYVIKHASRTGKVIVDKLLYRMNINSLHREEGAPDLQLNDIGRVALRASTPFFVDEYRKNKNTGSFILIDEATNVTVGAGMIVGAGAT